MKKLLALCLLFSLFSCDLQKRLYRKGFYWGGLPRARAEGVSLKPGRPAKDSVLRKTRFLAGEEKMAAVASKSSIKKDHPAKSFRRKKKEKEDTESPPEESRIENKKVVVEEIDFREEKRIKELSVISLVLSILSIIPYLGILGAIIAIILGRSAIRRAESFPYPIRQVKMARAGVTIGVIVIILYIAFLIFALALIALAFP